MRAVLIDHCLVIAAVGTFFQPLFHAANILSRFPEAVVLCSDQNQLAYDVLDLYHFFFRLLSCFFGVDKQAGAAGNIS